MLFIKFRIVMRQFLHRELGKRSTSGQLRQPIRRADKNDYWDSQTSCPKKPNIQDIEVPPVAISEVQFGTRSDFGLHNPFRFFGLPASRPKSHRRQFGIGSVSAVEQKGRWKSVWDSSAFRHITSECVYLIIPWSQVRVLAGPPPS